MTMQMDKKLARYRRIHAQLEALMGTCESLTARMATLNALLYHKMDGFFWVGFYLLNAGKLQVGTYQGPLACMELSVGKGVCWAGMNTGNTLIVPDVHEFPGHIACDSRSLSEIVVPVRDRANQIIGVLDVDSNRKNNFDQTDAEQLEELVALLFS